MSLPWSAQQREWLREMGFEVLARRSDDGAAGFAPSAGATATTPAITDMAPSAPARLPAATASAGSRVADALQRAAGGVDLAPLLAGGPPRDAAERRAFWRVLRPLRKAARSR